MSRAVELKVGLDWFTESDDDRNDIWTATSRHVDLGDGDMAVYRITPYLTFNRQHWHLRHSSPELGFSDTQDYVSLDEAKDECLRVEHAYAIAGIEKAIEGTHAKVVDLSAMVARDGLQVASAGYRIRNSSGEVETVPEGCFAVVRLENIRAVGGWFRSVSKAHEAIKAIRQHEGRA